MTFKSLVFGGALATALAVSTAAQAAFVDEPATYGAGLFGGPVAATTLGAKLTPSDAFYAFGAVSGAGTAFTHTVNFYTEPGELIGDVTSARLEMGETVVTGIDDLTVSLNGEGARAMALAGLNTATVTGVVAGSSGTYDLNVAVSQVPLPGAALLFGSGLAGLGLVSRRRRHAA